MDRIFDDFGKRDGKGALVKVAALNSKAMDFPRKSKLFLDLGGSES